MLVLEGGNENDLHVCKWTWVLEFFSFGYTSARKGSNNPQMGGQ